jgi:hypothetical protein
MEIRIFRTNVARLLEVTVEEKFTNNIYDERLFANIQSAGRFVKIQRSKKSVNGDSVNWSVFPRFYVVPNGYPINNIEERFAKLVGWQLTCFQQRVSTMNNLYIKRLNATSGEWFFPEHTDVDLSSWDDRSSYMNDCYVVLEQAENHCEALIEEYLLEFARNVNIFVSNVQNNINEATDLFEDYKNMQINNAICNTYGFLRKLGTISAEKYQHLKSSMLIAGNTAIANLLQASLENNRRCAKIDWTNAFSWLGIPLPISLSMFMGCDVTSEQQIKRAANNPASTGTPPAFNHVFFGKHKLFDFTTGD